VVISGLGFIVLLFTLPETMGIPLEEMARLFGDEPDAIAALAEQKEGNHVAEIRELKVHEGKQDESYA
jgi:hypothetical protein